VYPAFVAAIIGQALLLTRPVLLICAAVLLAAQVAFVHWLEPTRARRFAEQYEAYCRQVPGWWPRLTGRTPGRRAEPGTRSTGPMENV
jgi:protein-S-isoprenylcysteine O-methyltransferase Ste14